jgi:hypothetical protein
MNNKFGMNVEWGRRNASWEMAIARMDEPVQDESCTI